ncbi:tRNAHis guanylyltransferase-domain-containing protein [Biscogniauxia marginata]|nr:tRNAHis guanylyltransferase-domain-containing protein [Biscogniauxia marginata]
MLNSSLCLRSLTLYAARSFHRAAPRYSSTLNQNTSNPACLNDMAPEANHSETTSGTPQKPTLGDRMKQYEAALDFTLPVSSLAILRLDGHGFSRFTSHFCRPFDQRIHDAMISTCADLLSFFPRATVAYTHSDEITLVFPEGVQAFNERVQKLVSLAASHCSVRFNAHLSAALAASPSPPVKESAHEQLGTARFDARVFAVPSADEALNCLLWRCRVDAVRNSICSFARTMFSQRQVHGRTSAELVEMMRAEKGVVYEEAVPRWALEGCLMKRELYEHQGFNPKTGEMETTTRTRTRVEERGVREFFAEKIELVTGKYW